MITAQQARLMRSEIDHLRSLVADAYQEGAEAQKGGGTANYMHSVSRVRVSEIKASAANGTINTDKYTNGCDSGPWFEQYRAV